MKYHHSQFDTEVLSNLQPFITPSLFKSDKLFELIEFFFTHPGQLFSAKKLQDHFDYSIPTFNSILRILVVNGFLKVEKVSNARVYTLANNLVTRKFADLIIEIFRFQNAHATSSSPL